MTDRLDLHDVTLVGNDTGGAPVQLLVCDDATRVSRIVLASYQSEPMLPAQLCKSRPAES